MPAKLSTLENALLFRYFGTDRLYTDHDGRRVIVDVEGFGIMRLVAAESPVLSVRWEGEPQEFTSDFTNGSIVLAIGSGDICVQVIKGRTEPAQGGSIRASGNYYGCGWVIGASSEFIVDDRHDFAPPPSEQFPVPFFRSIKGHGNWSIIPDASVTCGLVDSFSVHDDEALKARGFNVQNISRISTLESEFADGTKFTHPVASHLNACEFTAFIPADNEGLVIRKTYDRFHGRQRARVFVDGSFAGWWYEPGEDRVRRWHVSDFGIAAELTEGKSEVRIVVDPPAGVALWSIAKYDLFALRPAL
jgi:hypothetical protein